MANTSQHSSSSLSTLSPPSSDHNGTPATLTSSAVLFKGPHLSIFPSVAAHIAAQLRLSPPSSLKVLNGALIGMEKTKLSHFVSEKQEYRVGDYGSAVLNGVGQRNVSSIAFASRPTERQPVDSDYDFDDRYLAVLPGLFPTCSRSSLGWFLVERARSRS